MARGIQQDFSDLESRPWILGYFTLYDGYFIDFYFPASPIRDEPETFITHLHELVETQYLIERDIPFFLFEYENGALLVILRGKATVGALLAEASRASDLAVEMMERLES